MLGLITDRTQENIERRNHLASLGWARMTEAERIEWMGDPLLGSDSPVNLFPQGPYIPSGVSLEYRNQSVVATAFWDGVYVYAVSIIGPAEKYAGKTLTLSVDEINILGGGKPNLVVYWYDESGYEYGGASLSEAGSVTFTVTENTGNRANLALFIYVTTDVSISAGAATQYVGLMLSEGSNRQSYVPYTAVLPTMATKGAYNYSDLNRVELAVSEIAKSFGLPVATKTNWGPWDVPRQSDMARYLGNVWAIRELLPTKDDLPVLPASLYSMTYTTANDIEIILTAAEEHAQRLLRCGELYCGEV